MDKVKIGKKEYELESLSSLDLKKLEAMKEKEKLSDYDYSYAVILYAINKFNGVTGLSLEGFMDEFPIKNIDKKFEEIGEIIGLDFKVGIGESEDGKTQ